MTELLPPWPLFTAFMAASLVLAITPGPGVIYIVTRSAMHGRRAGLASVLGVAGGNLTNALGAALGLAALFAVSSLAFTLVKYAGAAYLLWLGYRMLLARATTGHATAPSRAPLWRVLRDGYAVAALNPKTAVFFAAFLPQFLASSGNTTLQAMVLGAVFVGVAAITDSIYAFAAGALAQVVSSRDPGSTARRAGGGILIGLGIFTAISGSRTSR